MARLTAGPARLLGAGTRARSPRARWTPGCGRLALAALRAAAVLPSAADPTVLLRADRAVVLDAGGDDLVAVLTDVLPDLLPAG